jgi:hypothetical protein
MNNEEMEVNVEWLMENLTVESIANFINKLYPEVGDILFSEEPKEEKEDEKVILDNGLDVTYVHGVDKMVNPSKKNEHHAPKKTKYDENIHFSYYGTTGNNKCHDGIFIICSRVIDSHKVVEYGMSYCSKNDTYDKEIGKRLAYIDLMEEQKLVALSGKKHHMINARILSDVVANADCPSWARKDVADALMTHLHKAFELQW